MRVNVFAHHLFQLTFYSNYNFPFQKVWVYGFECFVCFLFGRTLWTRACECMRRNRVENKLRNDLILLLVGCWVLRSCRPVAIALVMSRARYCEKKWRTSKAGRVELGVGPFEASTGDAAPATATYEHVYLRVWGAHRIENRRRGTCTNSKLKNAFWKMKFPILNFRFNQIRVWFHLCCERRLTHCWVSRSSAPQDKV
jgi:hypothetical protein